LNTAAEGSWVAFRSVDRSGLPNDIGSLIQRELERAHSLALQRDASPLLALVGDFFGDRVGDDAARSAIDASLRRAEALAGAQRPSNAAVMSFAAEAFDICALDCGWGAPEAAELVRELAADLGESAASTAAALFLAASRNPQLLQLPPRVALQMQLEILVAFAPVEDVSVWIGGPAGSRLRCARRSPHQDDAADRKAPRPRRARRRCWKANDRRCPGAPLGCPLGGDDRAPAPRRPRHR